MIGDLTNFTALRERMRYLQARQKVLAENVANADTPSYKPKDMAHTGIDPTTRGSDASRRLAMANSGYTGSISPTQTNPAHIGGGQPGSAGQEGRGASYGTRPSGNAVNLEDEMLKISQNQLDFQMVAGLYQRGFSTLKIALGRKA